MYKEYENVQENEDVDSEENCQICFNKLSSTHSFFKEIQTYKLFNEIFCIKVH